MPENKKVRKLELCDIAPYAPFGLRIKILNSKNDYVGIEDSVMTGYYFLGDILCITYKGGSTGKSVSEFKPYLRPLDQLTQEITHGGRTFIPIIELAKIAEADHFYDNELKVKSGVLTYGVGWLGKDNIGYAFCFAK